MASHERAKEVLDRVRPELNPIAETLGPSFPSGHTTAAAAFYAAAALVLGRGVRPHGRALLAGAAAGIAVAVACTRVFLDVHWLTDTIAGLFLGWAWFAACSVAFGGRFYSSALPLRRPCTRPISRSDASLPQATVKTTH